MSYLGKVDMNDANIEHYSLTGSTLTTVNIGWTPASEQSLRVTINGVVQQGDTFSYSGANLTLGGPLIVTDTLEVVGIQSVGNIITPADNSVTTAKLADDAVTLAKMAGLARGKIIVGDASGDPSALTVGASTQVLTSDGTDASWAAAAGGGGKVLKVYQAVKTDTTSIASTTFADISGITLTTDAPDSTGSRFLVFWTLSVGIPAGTAAYTRLERTPSGGSDVYPFIGDAASNRPRVMTDGESNQTTVTPYSGTYLDSPASAVALTYTIQWRGSTGSTIYLNRTFTDRDTTDYDGRVPSSLVVMEIGS